MRFDDLSRERDFVRGVVQSAPSFFCLVDDRGPLVRFNQALEVASGRHDGDEARGRRSGTLFVVPDEADEVRDAIDRAFQRNQDVPERENIWATPSGERWTSPGRSRRSTSRSPGRPLLVTGMDVTERKRQRRKCASSRARIVEAASAERRRLERNLHDGAQQRLVSLSLFLRLAQGKVARRPGGRPDAPRRGARRARPRPRGAPRARARDPPGDPHRPRPRAGAPLSRHAVTRPGDVAEAPKSGCPSRSRRPRTTSWPRHSRTWRSTRRRTAATVARLAGQRSRDRRGRRRRRRRRRPGARLGTARPGRPGRGARRHAPGQEPARRRHHDPRGDSGLDAVRRRAPSRRSAPSSGRRPPPCRSRPSRAPREDVVAALRESHSRPLLPLGDRAADRE